MINIIEINYISPISNYVFDIIYKKYYIVIVNSLNGSVMINKIELPHIGNITNTLRSYHIGKGIQAYSITEHCSVKLFEHHVKTNEIKLLFSGNLDVNKIEYNKMQSIPLYIPSKVIDKERHAKYTNEISFLEDQFYNYESNELNTQNKCILFITKTRKSEKELIRPYIFKFDVSNEKFIFDRYNNNIIIEHHNVQKNNPIDSFCKSNTYDDYIKFVQLYNIDINRYQIKDKNTFKSMFMRQINLDKFRPLKYDPYLNNLISSPVDGRLYGFSINKTTNFKINNNEYHFKNLVTKPYELLNGSGFINRLTASDYQRIHIP